MLARISAIRAIIGRKYRYDESMTVTED